MKTFKTQREIYQALIDGKKIIRKCGAVVFMKDDGHLNDTWNFWHPGDWSVYCEQHEPEEYFNICKNCGVRLKMVWVEA